VRTKDIWDYTRWFDSRKREGAAHASEAGYIEQFRRPWSKLLFSAFLGSVKKLIIGFGVQFLDIHIQIIN